MYIYILDIYNFIINTINSVINFSLLTIFLFYILLSMIILDPK